MEKRADELDRPGRPLALRRGDFRPIRHPDSQHLRRKVSPHAGGDGGGTRVPFQPFQQLWGETNELRAKGHFPTLDANIVEICQRLNFAVPEGHVFRASALRIALTEKTVRARAGSIETLTKLRTVGYKIGLISDCTPEIPALWRKTDLAPLFDATTFSCEAHMRKPDPAIYLATCRRLGVSPQSCLYVGDGDSRELTGARSVGMHAVRIEALVSNASPAHRLEAEEWDGPYVARLEEVFGLLAGT